MSLWYADEDHNIKSELCDKSCKFILEDDSFHSWLKMKVLLEDRVVKGTASRLHFYPLDSNQEEDKEVG